MKKPMISLAKILAKTVAIAIVLPSILLPIFLLFAVPLGLFY